MTYRLTGVAEADLQDIHEYIAKGSISHATQMLTRFETIFKLLEDAPMAGTSREELLEGIRSYPLGSYIIFYHVEESFVIIDRVLHTRRDIEFIFNPN